MLPSRFLGGLSGIPIRTIACYSDMVDYMRQNGEEQNFTTYRCGLCMPGTTTCLWGMRNSTNYYTASVLVTTNEQQN